MRVSELLHAIKYIKSVYKDMTVRQLEVLLHIADEEGLTQFAYARKCNEADTVIHRTVKMYSELGFLVERSSSDNRAKAWFMSEKGKEFIGGIYGKLTLE